MSNPKFHWVLIGFWEGMACPITHGDYIPPFAVWVRTCKRHWQNLKEKGYYARRQHSRPVALVDGGDQATTPRTWKGCTGEL